MGEIARSKSRIASDLKTRDSNRWRPCDLKLRFETRDWRFVLNLSAPKSRDSLRFRVAAAIFTAQKKIAAIFSSFRSLPDSSSRRIILLTKLLANSAVLRAQKSL